MRKDLLKTMKDTRKDYDEKKNEVSYTDKMTIEEIGTRYDHTKEWARQTYNKALEKAPYLKSIRSVYK